MYQFREFQRAHGAILSTTTTGHIQYISSGFRHLSVTSWNAERGWAKLTLSSLGYMYYITTWSVGNTCFQLCKALIRHEERKIYDDDDLFPASRDFKTLTTTLLLRPLLNEGFISRETYIIRSEKWECLFEIRLTVMWEDQRRACWKLRRVWGVVRISQVPTGSQIKMGSHIASRLSVQGKKKMSSFFC